ncbi:2-amino-3,7-dideoxy-D-threo-hept-6-ulosonate synthase [Anaerosporobacter faecicola]|uniref:2-amino-3,7-dideoxy-D-threo-hept-6-ulosonate synthase n=1 Tax=Anaerosporobacter faecicola TaxID=2718714 RepID=UPI00143A7642|nr:2-amino-3,7-dideoxy-D-threo-hept-6-ulosonate synthase [Anaerosporobacter faecicola]
MIGKQKRLNRIFGGRERTIIVPMDHGFTDGPIDGIADMGRTLQNVLRSNVVNAVILHRGTLIHNYSLLTNPDLSLIMHLSGSTSLCDRGLKKIQTASVDEAIALGCDAVSVHVNLGNEYESAMLSNMAYVAEECGKKGMPLLAMMYVRGNAIANERELKYLKHAVRVADEMGADIVKVNYCLEGENFEEVVNGCQIPVIIAGGQYQGKDSLLHLISDAMNNGAKGVSIGRGVFQSNDCQELLQDIAKIVHEPKNLQEIRAVYEPDPALQQLLYKTAK